ncbi:MAG: DUF3108 domain-containing protein [Cellvibrionaceae bacterium]|nr:DUF3108 domain-containing protein [Cellvibrionaceae bacterium]
MSSCSIWLNRFAFLSVLLLGQAFGNIAFADTTLARGVYKGNISGWKADIVRTLSQSSTDRYQFSSEAKNLFASVREVSEFEFHKEQIRPLSYIYERKLFGRNTVERIVFDWNGGTAHYSRNDRPQNNTTHKLEKGILDPALYQLVMQADLALNRAELSYKFIKRKRIETYEFARVAEESLQIGKKSFQTQSLVREDKQDDRTTQIWIAPELDYQVGQIRHTDDGDTYQIRLAEYQGDSQALKQLYARISKTAGTESRLSHVQSLH